MYTHLTVYYTPYVLRFQVKCNNFRKKPAASAVLDKLLNNDMLVCMKTMPVGEFKAQFSSILNKVKNGEKIGIVYGRAKKPVAVIVPYQEVEKTERKIGILDGKVSIQFKDDFAMTAEELCNL